MNAMDRSAEYGTDAAALAGVHHVRRWEIDELTPGQLSRARITRNPRHDGRWPWRVTALDGRPLPKIGLLANAASLSLEEGEERIVRIVRITHADRRDRGRIELALADDEALPDDVWAPPGFATKIAALLDRRRNLLLVGPQGCGKTTIVAAVARRAGLRLVHFPCGAITDASEFSASLRLVPTEGGVATTFVPSPLLQTLDEAVAHPRRRFLVFLDELNRCPEEARNAIMPALDQSRILWDPRRGAFVPIPPTVLFAAAVNVGRAFSSTYGIDAAQIDRFAVLPVSWLPPEEEVRLLHRRYPTVDLARIQQLVAIATELRAEESLSVGVSVRATDEAADLLRAPHYATMETQAALLDVLTTSFCARFPGGLDEPHSEAAHALDLVRRRCAANERRGR